MREPFAHGSVQPRSPGRAEAHRKSVPTRVRTIMPTSCGLRMPMQRCMSLVLNGVRGEGAPGGPEKLPPINPENGDRPRRPNSSASWEAHVDLPVVADSMTSPAALSVQPDDSSVKLMGCRFIRRVTCGTFAPPPFHRRSLSDEVCPARFPRSPAREPRGPSGRRRLRRYHSSSLASNFGTQFGSLSLPTRMLMSRQA
jgi:hypothetical protein